MALHTFNNMISEEEQDSHNNYNNHIS